MTMGKRETAAKKAKDQLGKRRQDHRRLGLLALHAAERKAGGSCPSSEELARFLEPGNLPGDEYTDLIAHLAHCESCYREWQNLCQEIMAHEERKGGVFHLLAKPAYLTALGSGLAAAASIVVFLSISTEQRMDSGIVREELTTFGAQTGLEEKEQLDGKTRLQKRRAVVPAVSPVPAEDAAVMGAEGEMELQQEPREAAAQGPKRENRAAGSIAAKGGGGLSVETSVHRSYLQLVSSFCQEPFPLEPDAASLLARGKKILKASFSFSRDQTLQLEQIVSLLEQSPDKDRQALCTSLATVIPKDDWMLIPVQGKEGLSR